MLAFRSHSCELSIVSCVFVGSTLLSLFLSLSNSRFQLPEFAPPQLIYSKDLVPLLLAPWTSPSSLNRALSRLLQSALLLHLPKDAILPTYLLWIVIGLSRTLLGFILSRGVGWAYPRLFNHWALYESSGGCGPPLVTYLLASGVRPDFGFLLAHLRGYKWEPTESLVILIACGFVTALDKAPWTYGIAVGLALLILCARRLSKSTPFHHPGTDSIQASLHKPLKTGIQTALVFFALIPISSVLSTFLTTSSPARMPSSSDGAPFLEILILSYPRPNDTPSSPAQHSILSKTIASYLPYVSSSTALSVFTHARPANHPSFTYAQQKFQEGHITFYADQDTHTDAYEGQYLHVAEAFRWFIERSTPHPEWVMLVEDDFPICGEWGWQGVLHVMETLHQGHNTPSPETTKMWGGFVGTGGSGLILHHTLLPILASTLRLHARTNSPFPPFMARRPADVVMQDCLLGIDPLCPTASPSKDVPGEIWFARKQPTMVITSRLVMDHIGSKASTARGRVYDSNKWRCGWRHPFHGRSEAIVVPV